ncbi:MAG: hypothetical protein ACRDKK_04215 [Gaiellaceae bacterium]
MNHRVAHVASIVALLLALVLTPAAVAAKTGENGGRDVSDATSSRLTVSPTSVASGDVFTGSGCGYVVGKQVNVVVTSPSSQTFFPVGVDGGGCIMFRTGTGELGQYTVQTFQRLKGRKQTLMGSASLTVY